MEARDLDGLDYLDAPTFARRKSIAVTTVYRMVRRGELRAVRHPSLEKVLIPRSEVERFDRECVAVIGAIRSARRSA